MHLCFVTAIIISFLWQNPGILELCQKQDISVPHGLLTIESHPIYTHSGLSQGTYQTNKHNHLKEIRDCGNNSWIENVYKKYLFCHKKDILTSHGSFTKECDPIYYVSGSCKSTNQTNKHTHFKEIRGWVCGNDDGNIKCPYKLLCFAIRKTYWPLMAPLLENVTLPNPILVWVRVPI